MKVLRKFFQFITKNIIIVLIILIGVTSLLLYWLQGEELNVFMTKPQYHFYVIAQNSVDPFWREVKQGIEDAAKQHNVVVEFNAPRFNNPQEELKYLDIAVISNVDGIITHVSSGFDFTKLINRAYRNGIPVVTIENDDKGSNRSAFIGTNSFLLGKEAAELMIEATGGKANIAIIASSDFEPDVISQNIKINGFLTTIKEYPDMHVKQIYTSKMGILSAEEITQDIVNNRPDINAILTMNTVDTLGSAQLIVDHNEVGNITLIGYGDTKNILRYIEKRVIYGTVMSDPYKMGFESLKALIDIKEGNSVSTFIDTGVKVITQENFYEYEKKTELQNSW